MAKLIHFRPDQPPARTFKKAGRPQRLMEEAGQLNMFDQREPDGKVIHTYLDAFTKALHLDEMGSPQAIEAYREAIKKDIRRSDAHCNIGIIHAANGNTLEALASMARSLAINPANALAHFNMGNLYFDAGDLHLAQLHYQMAFVHGDDMLDAHFNIALVLYLRGYREAAEQRLKAYSAMSNEDIDIDAILDSLKAE